MPPTIALLPADAANTSDRSELGRFAEMIGALTAAIDLAEGNGNGHALRTCIIGMKIGQRLAMSPVDLSDLFYALLLKDIAGPHTQSLDMSVTGQGGLRARRLLREGRSGMSWREAGRAILDLHQDKPLLQRTRSRLHFFLKREHLRAETVAVRVAAANDLLDTLGVSSATRSAICSVDEKWNGRGAPGRLRGLQIPVIAQIVKLAQTMEFFSRLGGEKRVVPWLHRRCRGWFDPGLVAAASRLFESPSSWWHLDHKDLLAFTVSLEPRKHMLAATSDSIDRTCEVFAEVADARSLYSKTHSAQVADIAVRIARVLKMSDRQVKTLRRAALLHSLGKLAVPRHVLEQEGALSAEDQALLREYPLRTYDILHRVPELQEIAQIAMSHHERLDGSGYPNGFSGDQISRSARILAVADVAAALAAERSFRKKYSGQQIYKILTELTPHKLDAECVNALMHESVMSLVA